MIIDECICFCLTKAQNTVLQHFKKKLAQYDITPVQFGIINDLCYENSRTATQVAQSLGLDGSTITGILDRMESKDLLKRTRDPNDRRVIRLMLTEKAFQLRKPLEETVMICNQNILSNFSEEEQIQLKSLLERISRACKE